MTPQPNPAGRTRRNVDELRQLARDCGWHMSTVLGDVETWRHPAIFGEHLAIPADYGTPGFAERYDAALARLTPEPHAHAAAPAGAMEAIAEILREVNPRTWVEHTPSGLAYHLAQAAYPFMVAQAHADAAFTARNMCHWVQGVGDARDESHEAFHYGTVCPYEAVAAVLSGQPDPRDAAPVEEPQARAFLQCTYPPGMTLIASGRESFCTDALERWVTEHPLPQYTRAYVVTVAAETICEPGVGVYTVPTVHG